MSVKRQATVVTLFLVIVGGAVAASKQSDAEVLVKVGRTVSGKVSGIMPDSAQMTGPIGRLQTGDLNAVDERVRVRLRTDKAMEGSAVIVTATGPAAVKLGGVCQTSAQRLRAAELAQTTTGVEFAEAMIAVPDGR